MERRLPSNALCLTIYGKLRDTLSTIIFMHKPAVRNALG